VPLGFMLARVMSERRAVAGDVAGQVPRHDGKARLLKSLPVGSRVALRALACGGSCVPYSAAISQARSLLCDRKPLVEHASIRRLNGVSLARSITKNCVCEVGDTANGVSSHYSGPHSGIGWNHHSEGTAHCTPAAVTGEPPAYCTPADGACNLAASSTHHFYNPLHTNVVVARRMIVDRGRGGRV
jgi:hypothetical protein